MIDVNIMPFAKLMGVKLLEASPDRVVAEMPVREDLCTTNSILHGGAYMAFADTIGAVATVLNLPKGAGTTTVESKTNFVSAIKAGETARAECTPVHRGRMTQVWQTRILRPDGKLAAIITQTQMVLAPKE
jgi:1,4-dihydroxy-2-naphthoyl-CoA hydrolase